MDVRCVGISLTHTQLGTDEARKKPGRAFYPNGKPAPVIDE